MEIFERAVCRGTTYLGVFVYECESIGDVVVAKMNNAGADPGADLLLGPVDDLVHSSPYRGSRLNPVETLKASEGVSPGWQGPEYSN